MTAIQFGGCEEKAGQARQDYMAGKITVEDFFRRVNTAHGLSSYDNLLPEGSCRQKRAADDLDFDPVQAYPSMVPLDLGENDLQWEHLSPESLIREGQKGPQRLCDK